MIDVQEAYNDIETAESYVESVDSVGLWESENGFLRPMLIKTVLY